MNEIHSGVKDIEVDGNTVRFINVRKGSKEAHEPSIVIEGSKPRKCERCGMSLWNGLEGNLCLNCLCGPKRRTERLKARKE